MHDYKIIRATVLVTRDKNTIKGLVTLISIVIPIPLIIKDHPRNSPHGKGWGFLGFRGCRPTVFQTVQNSE